MANELNRILVTGANGHLGRALLHRLAGLSPRPFVRAAVRSERAADSIRALPEFVQPEIDIVDYRDAFALARASDGCTHAVHLVGTLKETRDNRYEDAHEKTSTAFARAAGSAGIRRIVSLSIVGADPNADNECLASKGRADRILLSGKGPALILRLPMVLGRGDQAAHALQREATANCTALVRGGATLEQPIAADDVLDAILNGLSRPGLDDVALNLAGPESLTHRALVERVAAHLGTRARIIPIPLFIARFAAVVAQFMLADPPMTVAMLGVLEQDDDIDPGEACRSLGIELTPLDETIARSLSNVREDL